MRLSDSIRGSLLQIEFLPQGDIRQQAIRLGLFPGAVVLCLFILPNGPVIVQMGTQELAIGRRLARQIEVRPLNKTRNTPGKACPGKRSYTYEQ